MSEISSNTSTSLTSPATRVTVSRSAVSYRIGGRDYPMTSIPQCKVCQHPDRVEIERRSLSGYGPTAIHRALSAGAQEALKVRNIMDHCRNHLPLDLVARQAIVDARAREIGVDIEQATNTLVDQISFARVGLQRAYERMALGEVNPGISDGIAFARFLQDVEEKAGGADFDQEVMLRGFMAYIRAMQKVCSPEQIREISRAVHEDPIMASMLRQAESIEIEAVSA